MSFIPSNSNIGRLINLFRKVGWFALLFGVIATQAVAQQSLRIAATVNDEMISVLDLQSRISLVAAFSGFPNTQETYQRLAPQVVQTLIDDRIRMQEAKRLNITATESELNAEKSIIANRININPDQLETALEQQGINPSTLTEQLEAKIVWGKIIRSRYARNIQISDEEVEEVIAEIRENKGKPEYLGAEIYLPADNPEQFRSATELATRLVQQIQNGANFSSIAQNFSQSASAVNGGTFGWSLAEDISSDIRPIIEQLSPGQISSPHRASDGVYIVMLRAKRISRGLEPPPPVPAKVTLHQLHLVAPQGAGAEQIDALKRQAEDLTRGVQGCQAFDEVAKLNGSPLSGKVGTFEIDKISQQMQNAVTNLPIGQPAKPQFSGDGVVILMVCDREVPVAEPVDLDEIRTNIRNQLTSNRLQLSARRHLRDLRRAAFIDMRL